MDSREAYTRIFTIWLLFVTELFTDDVIKAEGIRVELSQLATKHLNTPSNELVTS